jgi:hypothetical protein
MKEGIFIGMRLILILLLIIIIIYDIDIPIVLNTQTNQMIIAILIIFIIIVIDEIIGFLIGLIFLIIYFKYYQKKFNNTQQTEIKKPLLNDYKDSFIGDVKPETNTRIPIIENDYVKMDEINGCIEMPYISNELLEKAQTNIYDINNYYNEIKISQDSYGIQGLNADMVHYSGFDKNEIIHNYI